jgi:hypothetical protein
MDMGIAMKNKTTLFGDIAVCLMATACGCFYYYENYTFLTGISQPEKINYVIKLITSIIAVLIWCWFSFKNGAKKRVSFLSLTFILWFAAEIYAVSGLSNRIGSNRIRSIASNVMNFTAGIFINGVRALCEEFSVYGVSYYGVFNILIIIYVGFFGLGLTVGRNMKA